MTYPLPPHERTGRPHLYAEAFCLMKYQTDAGEVEMVWNSRDGITPFCIRIDGEMANHVEWARDQYLPNYVPEVGSRIFVDLTPDRARETAEKRIAYLEKDQPQMVQEMLDRLELTRAGLVATVAFDELKAFWPHSPDLVEVTPEMQEQFRLGAEANESRSVILDQLIMAQERMMAK